VKQGQRFVGGHDSRAMVVTIPLLAAAAAAPGDGGCHVKSNPWRQTCNRKRRIRLSLAVVVLAAVVVDDDCAYDALALAPIRYHHYIHKDCFSMIFDNDDDDFPC
jgi:hypothetical protein